MFTAPITRVLVETPRNRIVRVARPPGFPPHRAGQYVSLGDHGQDARRPYSLASAPTDVERTGELEFLIQVVDGESPGTHLRELAPGRLLDLEAPAGGFVLPERERVAAAALVGGGTGIAPLRAILRELLERPDAPKLSMLQSARTPEELSYREELGALARSGRVTLVETVTRDAPASWPGRVGRIAARDLAALVKAPETWCFVCGPDSLVEDVPRLLAAAGVAPSRIRTEHWSDAVAVK